MDEIELLEKISKKENYRIEFKEKPPDKRSLVTEIVCFSNADGGEIFIGIDDSGNVVGVENADELMRTIDDMASQGCEPPVTVLTEPVEIKGKTILVIRVPKGSHRPYRTNSGQYYIRSTNRCRQASREELLRLFQASESLYYDESPVTAASFSDLDLEYFEEFIYKYLKIEVMTNDNVNYLKNLRLLTDKNIPTVSGLLFFGKKPQKYLPNFRVVCAYISGNDISLAPSDRKDVNGKVADILNDVIRFFNLYLKERHEIKGFESELKYEMPEVAIRETMVNAIAHRDYTIQAPIRALIFKNRVEIHSPGKLPNTVTIESIKIGGSHVLRNPTIYNLLLKMGLVTDTGSGVRRVIQLIKDSAGKDVLLKETEGEFIVTIPRKQQGVRNA